MTVSMTDLNVLILVGSPHKGGKSTDLATALKDELDARGINTTCHHLASDPIRDCVNCGACTRTGNCVLRGDTWDELSEQMTAADLVFVIAPVYFAGPSGVLKSMLDRCQMFWSRKYLLKEGAPRKKPAYLLVIGDGGDPFGYEPMVTICTSALNCANVRIGDRIEPFVAEDYDLARAKELVEKGLAEAARWHDADDVEQFR